MEKVSLHSKSNSSLTHDPSSYPKDLDPFGGEEEVEEQLGQTTSSYEVIKPSAPSDPSYPGTLDPFAEEEVKGEKEKEKENCDGFKSNNHSNRSSKILSPANQEKNPNNISTSNDGGDGSCVTLETSITSRASDYDESLDPFGGDDDDNIKADDRKSIVDNSKELRKPAIYLGETTSFGGNRTTTNDNLSIKSETESSSSGEIIKRGGEERNSYSNQNSPVPVPPRRKHRNVSPSTKSLNRASYSASSLERVPANGISSPSSPDPNRLSTADNDSYLSHSTSNLSIRSNSPNTIVRSPIRSRKKRRAPDPPGFPSSPLSNLTPPVTPNTSLTVDHQDTSIDTTIGSIHETINDSVNETKNETTNETPCETNLTPNLTPESVSPIDITTTDETNSEPITESISNETPIETNPEVEIKTEKEREESIEPEIDNVPESTCDQKFIPTDETSSEPTSEQTNQSESQTSTLTTTTTTITTTTTTNTEISCDLTADPTEKLDHQDQSISHQDSSINL